MHRTTRTTRSARSLRVVAAVLATATAAAIVPAIPAGAAAPDPYRVVGPDFSHWSHPTEDPIAWRTVQSKSQEFAFMKATQGTSFVDWWFQRDWQAARAVGIARGAYHFADPHRDLTSAVRQAQHFLRTVGPLNRAGDLPPVLDLESDGGLPPQRLAQWARTWLDTVEKATGRVPIIYTGLYFWRDQVANRQDFARYPLWIAYYPSNPNRSRPWQVGGWPSWTFWQYTDRANLAGVPADGSDHSVFNGTVQQLDRLALRSRTYRNPKGAVTGMRGLTRRVHVAGWAVDTDTNAPIEVRLRVDGKAVRSTTASRVVSSPLTVHRVAGADRGYYFSVAVPKGRHTVCVVGINVGAGQHSRLGCGTVRA